MILQGLQYAAEYAELLAVFANFIAGFAIVDQVAAAARQRFFAFQPNGLSLHPGAIQSLLLWLI